MLLLSHKLNIKTPGFNNSETIKIKPVKEIKNGGSSNNYNISLPNHSGTHIDSSKHFDDKGKSIAEYSIENFIFKNTKVIDIYKELITYGVKVDVNDPWANKNDVMDEYEIELTETPNLHQYQAIILTVAHKEYTHLKFNELKRSDLVVFDTKSVLDKAVVDSRL